MNYRSYHIKAAELICQNTRYGIRNLDQLRCNCLYLPSFCPTLRLSSREPAGHRAERTGASPGAALRRNSRSRIEPPDPPGPRSSRGGQTASRTCGVLRYKVSIFNQVGFSSLNLINYRGYCSTFFHLIQNQGNRT